jgi:hypothetical protein
MQRGSAITGAEIARELRGETGQQFGLVCHEQSPDHERQNSERGDGLEGGEFVGHG